MIRVVIAARADRPGAWARCEFDLNNSTLSGPLLDSTSTSEKEPHSGGGGPGGLARAAFASSTAVAGVGGGAGGGGIGGASRVYGYQPFCQSSAPGSLVPFELRKT